MMTRLKKAETAVHDCYYQLFISSFYTGRHALATFKGGVLPENLVKVSTYAVSCFDYFNLDFNFTFSDELKY